MNEKFALSSQDRTSPTWAQLKEHLERELQIQRGKNDAFSLGPDVTASIRGRIAQIKDLLALDKDVPASE